MTTKTLSRAAVPLGLPEPLLDIQDVLAKLSPKDRQNVERHLAACDAEPDSAHGALYRRLMSALTTLAPFAIKTNGQQSVQWFIQDGKYRMQVFALQDLRNDRIVVFAPNVIAASISAKVLSKPTADAESTTYQIGKTDERLMVDILDGKTPNPDVFYKHMLGWNREAIRIVVPLTATPVQVQAVESLCALGARQWMPQ